MRFKNTWNLYECICRNGCIQFLELVRIMGWSTRKVRRHVKRLRRDGLVKWIYKEQEESRINDRAWFLYPTPVKELINQDEMKNDEKIRKNN